MGCEKSGQSWSRYDTDLLLKYNNDGLSRKAIADRLGRSENSISIQLSRHSTSLTNRKKDMRNDGFKECVLTEFDLQQYQYAVEETGNKAKNPYLMNLAGKIKNQFPERNRRDFHFFVLAVYQVILNNVLKPLEPKQPPPKTNKSDFKPKDLLSRLASVGKTQKKSFLINANGLPNEFEVHASLYTELSARDILVRGKPTTTINGKSYVPDLVIFNKFGDPIRIVEIKPDNHNRSTEKQLSNYRQTQLPVDLVIGASGAEKYILAITQNAEMQEGIFE